MKIDWRKGACLTAGVLAVSMTACAHSVDADQQARHSSGSSISCQFQADREVAFVTVKAGAGTTVNLDNVRVEVYDAAGHPLQGFTPIFDTTYLHAGHSAIGYANAPLNDARSCAAAII